MFSQPIALLQRGIDVSALRAALDAHPELWNKRRARTESPDSPHHGLDDIWARWAPEGIDGSRPHDAVWYDDANILPVRELVYPMMGAFGGDRLGGVLITRIPPGTACRPHVDGGWHAGYYQKFAIQIVAVPGQTFCFDDAKLETAPGDLFWFNNSRRHWVDNPTSHERITLIACIKTDWRL